MKNLLPFLSCGLLLAGSPLQAGDEALAANFSSPEALMQLGPELRSPEGKFQIPNPKTDLAG